MNSLYRRLTLTHTLVALVAVLVVGVLAGGLILRAFDQLGARQARNIEPLLARAIGELYSRRGSWAGVERTAAMVLSDRPLLTGRRLLVADSDYRVVFDSGDEFVGEIVPSSTRRQMVPIRARGEQVGYLAILVGGENLTLEERSFVRSTIGIILIGCLVGGSLSLLIALGVARQLTRPLHSMTRAARRLAAGERHEPLPMPRDPEFAELARAFNSMAAELARQEDLRRGMVADIAHELRTPLSVLHLKVESFEDGIETPNEQSLLALQGQIAILTRLVDDLRLLSLADAGQLSLSLQPVDARAAIEQAAHAAHDHARQRGVELRLAPANDLPPICADPQRLAQILGNLLENALRYTPPGGSVTLSAASAHDSVTFAVSDTGPGIPTEDLPQIFNRFYRTDRARARETGGSGLGLAIVQRLVEAQNGTIDVTSAPGHGTTFRVALPTASKR